MRKAILNLSFLFLFAATFAFFAEAASAVTAIQGKCGAEVFDTKLDRPVDDRRFDMISVDGSHQFIDQIEGLSITGTVVEQGSGLVAISATDPESKKVVFSSTQAFHGGLGSVEFEHRNYRISIWCR